MKIAAVIVTYNRLAALQSCLERTLALDFSQVIVINNNSSDGTRQWLQAQNDPRLHIEHLLENIGGSGGFACGLDIARRSNADWVVCYDDDAYPHSDALNHFQQENLNGIDAAAAAVYYQDGVICEMNRPSWNPFWHKKKLLNVGLGMLGLGDSRSAFHVSDDMYAQGEKVDIDSSSFVGFFIRRDWLEKIPLPDKGLFIYGDDILYTLTMTQQGGQIAFLPKVRFTHCCETMARGHKLYRPLWKNYFHFRNLIFIYRLAAGRWFPLVWRIKYLQWRYYARQLSGSDRSVYMRLLQAGVKDGLQHNLSRTLADVQTLSEGSAEY